MAEKKNNSLHGFSDEHVKLIRETVGSEAVSETEFQRFLYRASKLGLDPLDGQIHLLTRNQKNYDTGRWEKTNVIIIGIDGFRAVAERSGKLGGVIKEPVYNEKGQLVRATAKIYRNDWQEPAVESLPFREYCKTKEGKPVGMWASMPETLLKKCAEAAGYRMAFALELGGNVYIEEELDKNAPEKTPKNNSFESKDNTERVDEQEQKTEEKQQNHTRTPEPKAANGQDFSGELLLLDSPDYLDKLDDYVVPAFSTDEDETYFLIGIDKSYQAQDIVQVCGKLVKEDNQNRVYVEKCEVKDSAAEETQRRLYYRDGPKDGKKSDVTYALAVDKDGTKYYISASGGTRDLLKEQLSKVKEGDEVIVTGPAEETSKGVAIEMESISA
ncbi:MAG: recombinase RecT [Clostridiales bacterium]|nr:recombinase RecT [Clostridiales bacterium]MCF8022645.1 recombinase RecT [Clostridiales bacterium]